MTQDSINATKIVLVKNIYLYYVFILNLTHLSFIHFLLLFTPMYYNKSTDW